MKRVLEFNWEAIAGIIAALAALVLHLLHFADEGILLPIVLVLLALLLIRDLRRESHEEKMRGSIDRTEVLLKDIGSALKPSEAILIGPSELQSATERFVERMRGEVVWFNVCLLMFRPQKTFDLLLRPMIENPSVGSVRFISRHSEKELWEKEIHPRILKCCPGSGKVKEPEWRDVEGTVSFILAQAGVEGKEEALVSFWDEPFMSRTPGQQIPRYIFQIQANSSLVARLREIERVYRLGNV